MNEIILCPAGNTEALIVACRKLEDSGIRVVTSPDADVTHLLLPVPSFEADGRIKGGGMLEHILSDLPEDVTVVGGNLSHPLLQGYHTVDLLQDPLYIAENAAITADCAIRIAAQNLPVVFRGCPILIIGWGRIGKCLADQLKALSAQVTIAARKNDDRAMVQALGYKTVDPRQLGQCLIRYRVIFNTAPAPVLSEAQAAHCRPDCILIDLASTLGLSGKNVIWARGLPGKDAPESSGTLISNTVRRLIFEKEAYA